MGKAFTDGRPAAPASWTLALGDPVDGSVEAEAAVAMIWLGYLVSVAGGSPILRIISSGFGSLSPDERRHQVMRICGEVWRKSLGPSALGGVPGETRQDWQVVVIRGMMLYDGDALIRLGHQICLP